MPTTHHENILVPIPDRFLSSLWLRYAQGRPVSVAVLYSITGDQISVDCITAVTSKHRAIEWSEDVYAYINEYVHNSYISTEHHSSLTIPLS